jgi:hypothetical protein
VVAVPDASTLRTVKGITHLSEVALDFILKTNSFLSLHGKKMKLVEYISQYFARKLLEELNNCSRSDIL